MQLKDARSVMISDNICTSCCQGDKLCFGEYCVISHKLKDDIVIQNAMFRRNTHYRKCKKISPKLYYMISNQTTQSLTLSCNIVLLQMPKCLIKVLSYKVYVKFIPQICFSWILFILLAPAQRSWVGMGGGAGNPNFWLCFSSSWVNLRFHTENQLCIVPRCAFKVWVGGGVESEFSDRLCL